MQSAWSAAQGRQGPLDGLWVLTGTDGSAIYEFDIVDPGQGAVLLEGVYRDRRKGPAPAASGFLTGVERDGPVLRLRFTPRGHGPVLIELRQGLTGWSGDLTEAGRATGVMLRRG